MRLVLGNRNARVDGESLKGKLATEVVFPEHYNVMQAFNSVVHPSGVWTAHAAEDAKPAWVASDDDTLSDLISQHFGGVPVRKLNDNGAVGLVATTMMLSLAVLAVSRLGFHLKTNAGNDFQAKQMAGAASATAVAKWVAITANTTAPAAGDTTLTGEITTAGGGLVRQVGVYAHTASAASYTLTTTFTANGTDSLPVTIGKRGVFDAASAGNMVFETLVTPTATLSASGDQLVLTDTVTL